MWANTSCNINLGLFQAWTWGSANTCVQVLWRFSSSVVVKVVWAWTLGIFSPLWPTRLSFTVEINGCSHCKLSYLRTVTRLSLPSNYPAAESDCMFFFVFLNPCTQPEEARKKKKIPPEYQKCWNTFSTALNSQPTCPHWCSNFTQKYNNGTWPRPSTPLSLHKSPPWLQMEKVQVQKSQFLQKPCTASAILRSAFRIWNSMQRFHILAATQWMKLKTICFNVKKKKSYKMILKQKLTSLKATTWSREAISDFGELVERHTTMEYLQRHLLRISTRCKECNCTYTPRWSHELMYSSLVHSLRAAPVIIFHYSQFLFIKQ